MTKPEPNHGQPPATGADASAPINSRELLRGKRHLTIEHNGERYLLRVTSNNKLILTK